MGRTKRARSESGYYHVMIRGNNKANIFKDKQDKEKIIEILSKLRNDEGWKLYAYCIMDNHGHLIIHEKEMSISVIMKKINVSYAMYYNTKYDKVGHVFQDRYRSEIIEDEIYLLAAIRYIHDNPVKSRMVKTMQDYEWSSYNQYKNYDKDGLIDIDSLLEFFFTDKKKAVKEFIDFHKIENDDVFIEDKAEEKRREEDRAWDLVEEWYKENNGGTDLETKKQLAQLLLKRTNISKRKIAEMLEISRGIVQRMKK